QLGRRVVDVDAVALLHLLAGGAGGLGRPRVVGVQVVVHDRVGGPGLLGVGGTVPPGGVLDRLQHGGVDGGTRPLLLLLLGGGPVVGAGGVLGAAGDVVGHISGGQVVQVVAVALVHLVADGLQGGARVGQGLLVVQGGLVGAGDLGGGGLLPPGGLVDLR